MSDNTDKDDQMKIKIFLTLMIMLSMFMVCTANEGTFEIDDTIEAVDLDLTVEYEARVWIGTSDNTNYGDEDVKPEDFAIDDTKYEEDYLPEKGNFIIGGTISTNEKTYNVDMTANGWIRMRENTPASSELLCAHLNVDGKLFQNGEYTYLYKDKDNKYYGYVESGYNIEEGYIYYLNQDAYQALEMDFDTEWYSKYVITKSKPIGEFTLSSPSLGLGYKSSIAGDHIPELFTYRDQNTWNRVVSETYPINHNGPVICTPARIAGEPLVSTGYWDTAKGQRILQWKAANTA